MYIQKKMTEILQIYDDLIDDSMSAEEKQKAIAESDRLHVAGRIDSDE